MGWLIYFFSGAVAVALFWFLIYDPAWNDAVAPAFWAVAVFLGLFWLACFLKKDITAPASFTIGAGFTVIVGYLCIFSMLAWAIATNEDVHPKQIRFNEVAWKAEPKRERIHMVDDLIGKGIVKGMPREDVENLLGKPDQRNWRSGETNYDYIYFLGPERSLISIDSEWLAVRFADGKAIEIRTLTD